MRDIRLRVNGRDYEGWTRVRVVLGIESLCGGFSLDVSDKWTRERLALPIREEDECAVLLERQTVITGYVDRREVSIGPGEHSVSIDGRDRASALVDCSANPSKWEYRDTPILTIAKQLCEPHGISVRLGDGVEEPETPARFAVDPGETIFDVLSRACARDGLLPISDGRGGVVLANAGSERASTSLVEGENILDASVSLTAESRFASYRVLGQHAGSGDISGAKAAQVKGEAADAGVRRSSRTLVLRADGNSTIAQAKRRAQWEANVRAARAQTASVTVQGWTQASGELWPVNAMVHMRSRTLELDADMLIAGATFTLDESGSRTELALSRPDAFLPQEPKAKKAKAKSAPWAEIAGGV